MKKFKLEDTKYINEMDGNRLTRWQGLSEQIDFYLYLVDDGLKLSKKQIDHLKSLANTIVTFGIAGEDYYNDAMYVINKQIAA